MFLRSIRTLLTHRSLLLCSLSTLAGAAASAATVTVENIGPVMVYSLSNDGQAAAGQDASFETFRWTAAGGVVMLGRNSVAALGVGGGVPRISGDGQVVA
ncbi:MAG: hypothetical protein WAQ05_02230, partial [Rubrivivax sp.]